MGGNVRFRVHPRFRIIALQLSVLGAFALWLGGSGIVACKPPESAPPPPLPVSPWGEGYAYSYSLPANAVRKAPGSVPVTVAVVNPSYKESESALSNALYLKVGRGFSTSMGVDLDKILIAKGTTTTGPFGSLDEITYSDKKGAALTLAPKVFITADLKYTDDAHHIYNADREERHFVMSVTGWISFNMQEPMTGEKMWIKKIELEPVTQEGVIANESIPQYSNGGGCGGPMLVSYSAGKIIYDGRTDAMASALKQIYPVVLEQFQKFLDTDEMIQLKAKGQEIRNLKVYSGN